MLPSHRPREKPSFLLRYFLHSVGSVGADSFDALVCSLVGLIFEMSEGVNIVVGQTTTYRFLARS